MIPKKEFNKNGYTYKLYMWDLVARSGKILAIYELVRDKYVYGYEVQILRHFKNNPFSNYLLRHPSSEDFGTYGWSFENKESAIKKYEEMI